MSFKMNFTNEEKNILTVIIDNDLLRKCELIERIRSYRTIIEEKELIEMVDDIEIKLTNMTDEDYQCIDFKPELDLVEEEE